MRYRVEIRQAEKAIFVGPWFEESQKEKIKNDWEKLIHDASQNYIHAVEVFNDENESAFIPKSILTSSIIIIAKENIEENNNEK